MKERTGCAGVAIGQAARGNPWIFSALAGKPVTPSLKERIETLKRHLRLFADWSSEPRAAVEMRKHASWY